MNWFAFALATWVIFGLELALRPIFDAGSGGVHPSMVAPLLAFVAMNAPRKHTLWAAIILGVVMDLLSPMIRTDGGSAVIMGPNALGFLLAAHFILAVRGMLIRRNPLTLVVMAMAASAIAQVIVIAVFTARDMTHTPLVWYATDQLVQRSLSSLYTGISALLLSFVFFAAAPMFGFQTTVATRFARHI